MDLQLHLVNGLDVQLVKDFHLFCKFCLMYSLLLIYSILDELKVMFSVVC